MRSIEWIGYAWDDYVYWQTEDRKTLKRINALIKDISRSPFEGIGEPEPLKANYSGYRSRRIDKFNRIVYKVEEDRILIFACKGHYESR